MSWLALARRRRHVRELVEDATASLERDMKDLLPSADEQLARECVIFIYWSVHVGIVNAQTSALDRWLARIALHRQLRRASAALGDGSASLDLVACYEQRCREALATTPNIFLYHKRGAELPILPVTPSGAKLFLRRIGHARIPPQAVARLADVLASYFWLCVQHFQPRIRPRFP